MTFTIRGEADFIRLNYIEVIGFPNDTCYWGGYDAPVILEIKSRHFSVKETLYTSTGESFEFAERLKIANEKVERVVQFGSYKRNLEFSMTYDNHGHVTIKGQFSEQNEFSNELLFEFNSDQSFVEETLDEISLITARYGGMTGVK